MGNIKINSKTFYDPENRRVDILDSRFYFKESEPGVYYPSVTTVLEAFPKGYAFSQWQKDLGHNADFILQRAAETGSKVHDAIDQYLKGVEVVWEVDKQNYTLEEWKMILKFVEFWETFKPEIITNEVSIISDTYRTGGTIDLVCRINNEIWLIDAKSGNAIHDSHELQIATYAYLWNEQNPELFIQRCGILHLKAATRGPDSKGVKIQGKGWQLKEFDRHYKDAFKIFKSLRVIWDEINPDYKPANLSLPDRIIWADAPKIEEKNTEDIPIVETPSVILVEQAVIGYKPNGNGKDKSVVNAETNINKPKK